MRLRALSVLAVLLAAAPLALFVAWSPATATAAAAATATPSPDPSATTTPCDQIQISGWQVSVNRNTGQPRIQVDIHLTAPDVLTTRTDVTIRTGSGTFVFEIIQPDTWSGNNTGVDITVISPVVTDNSTYTVTVNPLDVHMMECQDASLNGGSKTVHVGWWLSGGGALYYDDVYRGTVP